MLPVVLSFSPIYFVYILIGVVLLAVIAAIIGLKISAKCKKKAVPLSKEPEGASAAVMPVKEVPAEPEVKPAVPKRSTKKKTAPAEEASVAETAPEEALVKEAASAEVAVTESKEEAMEEPTVKKEEKKASTAPKSRVVGKYDFTLMQDGYHYCLLANNGQLLYQSVGYTTLDGAKAGIETFKRAVSAARFRVRYDRGGKYSYVLDGKFYGEGYQNRSNCERAIESVKRFADTTNMAEPEFSDEDEKEFRDAKAQMKNASSVDWDKVAADEAAAAGFGKFMIDPEEGGASFTLLANNGQCLYTSRLYSDVKSAAQAVEAFKKAVYIGNFFITNDKFGNYRFALKGTGTNWYVGDSYAARERCQNSIESVKNFVKTAEIVINKTVFSDEES